MRINCPYCGLRDRREFYVKGSAEALWPVQDSGDLDKALYLRANPAGVIRELWHHEAGCRAWLIIERDTVTHDIKSVCGVADAH